MGKKHKLIFEQRSLESWLFEQEEPPADETPDEAIEAADEEEEGGDEPVGDEDVPEEGEDEDEEEEVDVTPDEEVKLAKSIDQDLEALLIDFETQARKSREIEHTEEETEITIEGLGLRFLLEQEGTYEDEIDLDRFASEVARLVKNYTSLLDMEKMLVNKAREFIVTRYGEIAEKEMIGILADKHDIEVLEPSEVVDSTLEVPIAVGAGTGGAGGGGGV